MTIYKNTSMIKITKQEQITIKVCIKSQIIINNNKKINNLESLYWMKHFSFRLAVINVCPVLVPSELLLSTHLPTSEGWIAELSLD